MPILHLEAGDLRASLSPELGSALLDLSILGPLNDYAPIMRRSVHPAIHFEAASFTLAPWPGRVAGGKFRFRGVEHQLRINHSDGTALHGDVFARPWNIIERSPVGARLSFDSREHDNVNFPWPFAMLAEYTLSPEGLRVGFTITNIGSEPFPAGLGQHPYFNRRIFTDDTVEVRAPVTGRSPCKGGMPVGPPVDDDACAKLRAGGPFGDPAFDHGFTLGEPRTIEIRWPASGVRVEIRPSPEHGQLVMFAPRLTREGNGFGDPLADGPPMNWFCVEPLTMAPDAFNRAEAGEEGTGLRVLEPGESLAADVLYAVDRI